MNTCARRRTGCSLARIIVYDLGFEECQRAQLANRSDITLRPFEFSRFPPHFDLTVAAGQNSLQDFEIVLLIFLARLPCP